MPNAAFLETFQLYKRWEPPRFEADLPLDLGQVPRPPIQMFCPRCKGDRTFNMSNMYSDDLPRVTKGGVLVPDTAAPGRVTRALYKCAGCAFERVFLLEFGPIATRSIRVTRDDPRFPGSASTKETKNIGYVAWCRKVGQHPRWEEHVEPTVAKALGPALPLFRMGLACEAEHFGIGAFAYYRRIVEDLTNALVAKRAKQLEGDALTEFQAALEAAKRERSFKSLVDLVKDMLPPEARPGNANPLGMLYGGFSEGLHGKTDEQCIEEIAELRTLMTALFRQLANAKDARELETTIGKIFDRRSQSGGQDPGADKRP